MKLIEVLASRFLLNMNYPNVLYIQKPCGHLKWENTAHAILFHFILHTVDEITKGHYNSSIKTENFFDNKLWMTIIIGKKT